MFAKRTFITIHVLLLFLVGLPSISTSIDQKSSGDDNNIVENEVGGHRINLPLVLRRATTLTKKTQRVNIPYFPSQLKFEETAVFWFGEVRQTDNYSDVRIGYTNEELFVHIAVFDRLLWYEVNSTGGNLEDWDSAALYLDMDGNDGITPTSGAYRFVGQLSKDLDSPERGNYQAAYQGNGEGWTKVGSSFSSKSAPRGTPNDGDRDSGWWLTFQIPFSSIGLSSSPKQGDVWGLGVIVHDRDDAKGTPIADKKWPTEMNPSSSRTWGQLSFGLHNPTNSFAVPDGSVAIRHGLNNAHVVDGEVGGHTNCGESLDRFSEWGDENYANIDRINIQNQYDLSDFPCYSKFYITFPMDNIPQGKKIESAQLTLYQFGNAGGGEWGPAQTSMIQVFTVPGDWNEETITWNNAPQAVENVSRSLVPWLSSYPGPEGIPRSWDVTAAASDAYLTGNHLNLALYSADSERHSGKYFWSSDFELDESRPTLHISWTNP